MAALLASFARASMPLAAWLRWFEWSSRSERADLSYLAWLQQTLQQVALVLALAVIFIYLLRLAKRRLVRLSKSGEITSPIRAQQLRTLSSVIYSVGFAVVLFVAALEVLPLFGVDMGPLLASAGIAGLAIGFGAQALVHDVINGFFILVENQYNVGDTVKIAGVQGSVEMMTLRRTVLRDSNGTLHTVPNSQIAVVSNLTRDWSQVTLHVATAYSESSDRVMQLLREVGEELRHDERFGGMIVAAPEVPGIERVAASEVDYLMVVKTLPGPAQYAVRRELQRRIKECFEKNGIKPPGPTQVYVAPEPTAGK